ncbi:MAG: hypothetical protein GTO62_06465, partial [Planctomycetales bacterium]|nr:hypothetical protein [Planctomycetales bacterium]NIP68909.1 hypothetical protein [Planctomycetales bacterium]
LWAAPLRGEPLDLRYIPVAAQMVCSLRTRDLFGTNSDAGLEDALGPAGVWLADWIREETGFEPSEIERLDLAFYPSEDGHIEYTLVVYLDQELSREKLLARWKNPTVERYEEASYYSAGPRAFYIPQGRKDVFACGSVPQMQAVIDTLEEAAWLPKALEKLRSQTVAQSQVQVLFLSDYVRSNRTTLYPGRLA